MSREMKDSGIEWIGEIPKDWKIIKIKYIFSYHKEIVNNRAKNYDRLALTLKGVIKRDKNDNEGLQPESFDNYQIIDKDELVFKLIDLENTATSRVGLSNFVGIVSPAYIVLKPNDSVESRYAEYFFLSMWKRNIFNQLGDAGVRSNLNSRDLMNVSFTMCTKSEQQRIVNFLDKKCKNIDYIINITRNTVIQYKQLKEAIITKTVTKGVSNNRKMKQTKHDFISKIPIEWNIVPLRYIGALQNGISKSGDCFGNGFPFVSYGDVYKNLALPEVVDGLVESTEDERERYSVKEGDIFFTRTSETIQEVGLSSVCLKTIDNATFAGFLIRVRPYKDLLLPKFSQYYFRSSHHRAYIVKQMNLVTRASLGQGLLKGMPVLIPPKHEQEEIVEYLDTKCLEIDTIIQNKENYIKELENYKKSLIYEYVTGKKEVPNNE